MNLEYIREIMFRQELYHQVLVKGVMREPFILLSTNDTVKVVMRKFDETGYPLLPVIDNESRFVGFITRTRLYSAYRQMMVDMSAE